MQKVEKDVIDNVPCEWESGVPIAFNCLILLHVIELANIIHFVDDQLLNEEGIVLGMGLQAQDSAVEGPDLVFRLF